ncbi:hypothetical protein KKG83_05360 [Candidatus Micrarchaeota archaeon]|nr:hypothetical protein [Candidatus Micrarchaeota archaeon]MBU2476871.1 hypothetical protein [Candidatus Micrarchaeota archaeon]
MPVKALRRFKRTGNAKPLRIGKLSETQVNAANRGEGNLTPVYSNMKTEPVWYSKTRDAEKIDSMFHSTSWDAETLQPLHMWKGQKTVGKFKQVRGKFDRQTGKPISYFKSSEIENRFYLSFLSMKRKLCCPDLLSSL